uniref:MANEC domain-containing protein n=1 Tax=Angiostrongylus cantonensis TaxID=6313 RepID=A0A0K0CVP6_ANGCA
LVPSTPCRNHSHTHCIVSWYRNGGSGEKVVTERKCGGVEDVTGCTLYNSKISRKVSTLQSAVIDYYLTEMFQVCSESCPGGECLSMVSKTTVVSVLLALVLLLYFF